MDESRESINDELDTIWKECPAYLIDWLRENGIDITLYISNMNKDINQFLKDIK